MTTLTGKCATPGCGHGEQFHFDDRDGMITDGPCERGRWTGVKCHCEAFVIVGTARVEDEQTKESLSGPKGGQR